MSSDALDSQAILADLRFGDARSITSVRGGWDTALWRVENDRGTFALRVFRAEQLGTYHREMAAMHTAATAGIPVPRIEAHTIWRDRPALLLTWCQGRTLLDELQRRPWRVISLGLQFGRTQARIHRIKEPEGVGNNYAWINWLGEDDPALKARLRALPATRAALLHLDYHPLNVMVDGSRISAVLDWANAGAGDPRVDLARTWAIVCLMPSPPSRMAPLIIALRRFLAFAWRRGYQQESGPTGDMALYNAWATAAMVRDLKPKLGRPGIWLRQHHLDAMRRQADDWQRSAGLTPS